METVTLGDWQELHHLLCAEHLELSSGTVHAAEAQKQTILKRLEDLHWQYYRYQLGMRQERDMVGGK
jgi:hypothetical protein